MSPEVLVTQPEVLVATGRILLMRVKDLLDLQEGLLVQGIGVWMLRGVFLVRGKRLNSFY
jgi:hypothetical protein